MSKEIDKYMTVGEAAERWGHDTEAAVKSRLRQQSRFNDVNQMVEDGLLKYWIKPGGKMKNWIISEDAMYKWFGDPKKDKNNLK